MIRWWKERSQSTDKVGLVLLVLAKEMEKTDPGIDLQSFIQVPARLRRKIRTRT